MKITNSKKKKWFNACSYRPNNEKDKMRNNFKKKTKVKIVPDYKKIWAFKQSGIL